jgi:hypothetical protein
VKSDETDARLGMSCKFNQAFSSSAGAHQAAPAGERRLSFDELHDRGWSSVNERWLHEDMTKAIFDGVVIAESDDVKRVEGMSYFHVQGNDDIAQNGAFIYRKPWPLAKGLVTDRIAFWQGVEIVDEL